MVTYPYFVPKPTVSAPVLTTTATPSPSTQKEPLKATLRDSKMLTLSGTAQVWYSIGSDSPVIEEVSSLSWVHCLMIYIVLTHLFLYENKATRILASAGSFVPALTLMTSPTTKSSAAMVVSFPSRITLQLWGRRF